MTDVSECNCGNCTNEKCQYWKYRGVLITSYSHDQPVANASQFTHDVGCLSHPRAREVLMADVVKKLEKHPEYCMRYCDIISLIRGGGKG